MRVLVLAHGERRPGPVDVLVGGADALRVARAEDLAAAHRVAGREVEDRLPREVAPVAGLELRPPESAERLPALLEERLERLRLVGRRPVLVVDERHGAAHDGPEAGLVRAEAEVGVLEVRLEALREAADPREHLALEVRAREDDPLDVARPGVLVHVRLERADLLAPERVREDVRAGVEEAPVRKDEPAARRRRRRAPRARPREARRASRAGGSRRRCSGGRRRRRAARPRCPRCSRGRSRGSSRSSRRAPTAARRAARASRPSSRCRRR